MDLEFLSKKSFNFFDKQFWHFKIKFIKTFGVFNSKRRAYRNIKFDRFKYKIVLLA
jgi:hypothetical protein